MIGSVTEARDQLAALEKRRKGHRDRVAAGAPGERGERLEQAQTAAHDAARAAAEAPAEHAARKAYDERGITGGPGEFMLPGRVEPSIASHPYIGTGHAADSPQADPPRVNPLPPPQRGMPRSIALSSQTRAAEIPFHVAASLSSGSPGDR